MNRTAVIVILIVALVGVAVSWAYNRGKWQERVDDLEANVEQTDQLQERYSEDSTSWAEERAALRTRDSVLVADSTRIARTAWRVTRDYAAVRGELDSLRSEIEEGDIITPTQYEAIIAEQDTALAVADTTIAACEEGRDNAEQRAANCEAQTVIDSTRIADLEELRGRLTSERDSAMALLKPPPLIQLTFDVGVGVACVYNGQFYCGPSAQINVLRFRVPIGR